MRFKNYINEIFDNPYEYNIAKSSWGMIGKFLDEESALFYVNFDFDEYRAWPLHSFSDGDWRISTAKKEGKLERSYKIVEIRFEKNGEFGMSKSNAFRVFATLKAMMEEEKRTIAKAGESALGFSGKTSDKGRAKFYKTLLKYIQKEFKYKYTEIYKSQIDNDTTYLAHNDSELHKVLK